MAFKNTNFVKKKKKKKQTDKHNIRYIYENQTSESNSNFIILKI